MSFEHHYRSSAARIPQELRKNILTEGWIHTAVNVFEPHTPMEILFDVYEEYVDLSGEHDDFSCHQCRQEVLNEWKKLEPYLKELEDGN
jgi:hypothetical protein